MYTSQAIGRVETLVQKALQNGQDSLKGSFKVHVADTLVRLRTEFKAAKEAGGERTIWPKMATKYLPDGDGMTAIWSPITNEKGEILGLRVISETNNGVARRQRVHLGWFDPEIK